VEVCHETILPKSLYVLGQMVLMSFMTVMLPIHDSYAPNSLGIHCMTHRKNLVVQTLSSLPLMICLKHLLQTLDNCFAHN
jgi:hypothetical protein